MNTKDCPNCEGFGRVWDASCPSYCGDLDHTGTCPTCGGSGEIESVRHCASCNEPEGSEYAKHCCTDDNMIEE